MLRIHPTFQGKVVWRIDHDEAVGLEVEDDAVVEVKAVSIAGCPIGAGEEVISYSLSFDVERLLVTGRNKRGDDSW